jgi:predicted DNA-binding protein with PD1-like motif
MLSQRPIRSIAAAAALAFLTVLAANAPAQDLPKGYLRAPPVTPGLAPKMQIKESSGATHVFEANFSTGDEILSGLTDLALKHHITAGYITGLGGLSAALLGFGDPAIGAFKAIRVDAKCELVSLVGHISERDGKPYVHLHGVVAFPDGSTKAGHVIEAHVAPVAEISVVATSMGYADH